MDSIASEAQSAADLGNIKGVIDSIKSLRNASQVSPVPVKTKDRKCRIKKWREFFKEILNS
jgi:hypothetical protein